VSAPQVAKAEPLRPLAPPVVSAPQVAKALPPEPPVVSPPEVAKILPPAQPAANPPQVAKAHPLLPPAPPVVTPIDLANALPLRAPAPPVVSPPKVASAQPSLPAVAVEHSNPAAAAPRLERISMGEVALVTMQRPIGFAQSKSRQPKVAEVRWAQLSSPTPRFPIRLLNAARYQGLAARTRTAMLNQGWRRIEIGNARWVRSQSLVMYPASRTAEAKRIAARFGARTMLVKNSRAVTVLLGRDSVGRKRNSSRG